MAILAPTHDSKIYQKYSKKSLQDKEKNKIAFCQDYELDYDKRKPILSLTFPLTEESNLEILKEAMAGVLEQNISMVLTGIGIKKYQNFFTELAEKYPKQIAILNDNEVNKRRIYAASDIFLSTSNGEACLDEMEKAMSYGVVPVSLQNELVADYNGAKEQGNAFVYKENSSWSFFAALIRALESFKFPYDWKTIQKAAMGGEELVEE